MNTYLKLTYIFVNREKCHSFIFFLSSLHTYATLLPQRLRSTDLQMASKGPFTETADSCIDQPIEKNRPRQSSASYVYLFISSKIHA
ncbi:hypothetical protein IC575_029467 [Cucumis melo]